MKVSSVFPRLALAVVGTLCCAATAQDVELFYFVKYQGYTQSSSEIVHLTDNEDDEAFGFEAEVELASGGMVTSATLTPPGLSAIPLVFDGEFWLDEFNTESLLELDSTYPNGSYGFSIETGSGTINATLNLAGDAYPNIPRVTNFSSAQAINSAADFTLTWNSFTGGTTDDFIAVIIEDDSGNEVFFSGGPGVGLDGTDNSVLIPAGTLSTGTTYEVEVMFYKITAMDVFSGAMGVAGYSKATSLKIKTTGVSSDTTDPWLNESSPSNGATDVAIESAIAFEFNESMGSPVDVTWSGTGLASENFSYVWSADGTILYAIYGLPDGLPQNTEINWALNDGASNIMQDAAGNALSSEQGSFTTSSSAATGDSDVDTIFLLKSQLFTQAGVTAQSENWYACEVGVDINTLNAVTAATLTTPTTPNGTLKLFPEWLGEGPEAELGYTTKAELDEFFPSSSAYQFSIDTARDGNQVLGLDLTADNYPNAPTVTNVAAMSAVDPDQALSINWNPFVGADSSESYYINVYITTDRDYDLYESPDGLLDGTSTSISIPAGTFAPGRSYELELEFIRITDVDDSTYPGATAVAGFSAITILGIQTTGTPIEPQAVISSLVSSAEIQIAGAHYVEYKLEASSDLSNWFQIQYSQTAFENGQTAFYDFDRDYFNTRFYRAVEVGEDEWSLPPVAIQGQVRDNSSNAPISGATVGTSLDSNTTTTDSAGNFFLHTSSSLGEGQTYSILINKVGYQSYGQSGFWGEQPRSQNFMLQSE